MAPERKEKLVRIEAVATKVDNHAFHGLPLEEVGE